METLLKILTEAAAQADRAELREALEQIQRQAASDAARQEMVVTIMLGAIVFCVIMVFALHYDHWKLSRKVAMLEAARNVIEERQVQHV